MAKKSVPSVILRIPKGKVIVQESELLHVEKRKSKCNVGFAKIYLEKTSLTAADFMNDRVLPFFDKEGISVLRVLTDRGSEYCGRTETHPYELYLHLNDIEHTKTKPRSPQTNGAVERLNQTIENEFYEVAFRKKLYRTLEEIQTDLDEFMDYYNRERTNQGRYCQGRTPHETFTDGLSLYQRYVFENPVEVKEVVQ